MPAGTAGPVPGAPWPGGCSPTPCARADELEVGAARRLLPAPPGRRAADDDPPRRVLPPARRPGQDRLRRGVHGRRLGGRRPGRRAHGVRPRGSPRWCRLRCSACAGSSRVAGPTTSATTADGARRNIERHYDLSNDLFALFLDETMTYSCAVFEDGASRPRRGPASASTSACSTSPASARAAGCSRSARGWGGLAIHAATTRGAEVTTLTLSREQAVLARQRALRAGVADRVTVELRDYREAAAASTRSSRSRCSRPSASATCRRSSPPATACWPRAAGSGCRRSRCPTPATSPPARSYTWIHKYVFPGGLIPSIGGGRGRDAGTRGCG